MHLAAIVGYVQKGSLRSWHDEIDRWIVELSDGTISDNCIWDADERLKIVREDTPKKVMDFRSIHTRTGVKIGDKIVLRHLWILMLK